MSQSLGVYIHIPFCIQRCSYCDFATYSKDQIQANDEYVETLCSEATKRQQVFEEKQLKTIYFGGGTPSLLNENQIKKIIHHFKNLGYQFDNDIEITMEVNPATLTEQKCEGFKQAGVNRISIGCQSFDDYYLKLCNREHNTQDTFNTIELVKNYFPNYSLDLLFSLPHQGLSQLKNDLAVIKDIDPPHVSAYCLTLADKHPMNNNRCSDEEQISMFHLILEEFKTLGLQRYEISNFAKEGYESKHNNLYWMDENYWGLGLSAHSYKKSPDWGTRFWNPSNYTPYMNQIKDLLPNQKLQKSFQKSQKEVLKKHESLTDYCHTHLRLMSGLNVQSVRQKYGEIHESMVTKQLETLSRENLVIKTNNSWSLTESGVLLSNRVFSELLFSSEDIDKI